jgi:hypothetical protein
MKIKMEKSKSIDILELVKYISSSWIVLTALMIFGGLVGFLFSFIQAPVYESSASFGVTIDYTQTGALSDVQEDQAMRGVGSILLSDSLIEEAVSRINRDSFFTLSEDEFRGNTFVDRGDFRWTIRTRDVDPQRAFQIASIWAAAAQDAFEATLTHAQTADSYLGILSDLQSCFQKAAPQLPGGYCGFNSADELLREITNVSKKIQAEKTASQGLLNALSVVLVNDAEQPMNPVRYQTNLLAAAGAMIGLLIGMMYFGIRFTLEGSAS